MSRTNRRRPSAARTIANVGVALTLGLAGSVGVARAQMPENCPMHAEHTAKAAAASAKTAAEVVEPARSPYIGEETRPIAGLSAERIAALRAGTGHGAALPAELNHYPGPRHLLDLAAQIQLRDDQARALRGSFDRMHERAVGLGERIVEGERALDRLFASGQASESEMARLTAEIATLEGELRAAHLRAHIEAKALLDADQVARYDAARGYAAGSD